MQPLAAMIITPTYWGDDAEEEASCALAMCGPGGLEALIQNLRRHSQAHRRHVQLDLSEPGQSRYGDPHIAGYRKWETIRKALVFQAENDALPFLRTLRDDEDESLRADAADLMAEIAKRKPQ